tara:strand:+ start:2529 stop:3161 length:633 start_codon:yes stop_codon:yes gene_type:complete
MKKKDIHILFKRFYNQNPRPSTDLNYTSPFTLLISVVMSAQATDLSVNKATSKLFLKADTPEKMIELGEKKIKNYIKTVGLFNTKAKNIFLLSKILVNKHNSKIPNSRAELEQLPGVGRKTANVVLNIVFNEPTIAVDTHIFRLSNRTGLAPGKSPLKVEENLLNNVPNIWKKNAHHWLILHGRYVCKARHPNCKECIIIDLCNFNSKNI